MASVRCVCTASLSIHPDGAVQAASHGSDLNSIQNGWNSNMDDSEALVRDRTVLRPSAQGPLLNRAVMIRLRCDTCPERWRSALDINDRAV